MDKVKVSQDVANAIEDVKSVYEMEKVLILHSETLLGTKAKWSGGKWDALNQLSISELAKALINGYEVEKTPEENLLEHFQTVPRMGFDKRYLLGLQDGIKQTLNILEIEIKGVNTD